jgi:hypothetical protein
MMAVTTRGQERPGAEQAYEVQEGPPQEEVGEVPEQELQGESLAGSPARTEGRIRIVRIIMASPSDDNIPYRSAHDLPSVRELQRQLTALKALTVFMGRDKRAQLLELERQIASLVEVVDHFYDLLGSRHWIFHDQLPTDEISAVLALSPEEAEARLVAIYQDRDRLRFMVRRLSSLDAATWYSMRWTTTRPAGSTPRCSCF